MANFINLTVTKYDGDTANYGQDFYPPDMKNIKLNATSTGISFSYEGHTYESTSYTSLSAFAAAVNTSAISGITAVVGVYDPSANTTQRATGAHNLLDVNGNAIVLPDNTRVWDGYYEVITTFTSPTTDDATLSIGIPTDDAAGIVAAVAIDDGGNPWDAGAPKAIIQVGTIAAISEKTTAARNVVVTVGVEAVTAGKMYVVLFCITTPT
jgi:hypothetical protein